MDNYLPGSGGGGGWGVIWIWQALHREGMGRERGICWASVNYNRNRTEQKSTKGMEVCNYAIAVIGRSLNSKLISFCFCDLMKLRYKVSKLLTTRDL